MCSAIPSGRAAKPYQDIPIMVFTRAQWDADKQGKFSIGAGGVDEEICCNQKYVFAASSRFSWGEAIGVDGSCPRRRKECRRERPAFVSGVK